MEATPHRLRPLVSPRAVAVVGASATRSHATGNQVLRNLQSAGFRGDLQVISRTPGVIEGVPGVTADEMRADVAVVAVGPHAVLGALEELHRGGVNAAIVMSVGLSDEQRAEMRRFSDTTGMLVHGPNCMGVINVHDDIMLWADEGILTELPAGDVSLVSQSGSGAIFVARSMTGVGFAHVISTGNETSISTADYLRYLALDSRTNVVGAILESIPDADDLAGAVAELRAQRKPLVVLKVGRSSAGAQATVAHTGALLADDALTTALFERLGVPLVADYDELAASLELLSHLGDRDPRAARTAVITISGGQAALAADLADDRGVELASLSEDTRAQLGEILPGSQINNPLDAGGSAYADDDYFARSLDRLAEDDGTDVVLAITDSQATLNDVEIGYEDHMVLAVRAAAHRHRKPFVIASSSSVSLHPTRESVPGDDVAVIRGIGNALAAIRASATATAPAHDAVARPTGLPDHVRVAQLREELSREPGAVDGARAREVLREYGVPFVESATFARVDDAVAWADRGGYPVVAKIDSPDITHRSDIGGVVVGIGDDAALRAAWERIRDAVARHAPDARIAGVEVQTQVGDWIEAFVGALSDPRMGATVGVGLGGVLVELVGGAAHALAPLGPGEARRLVERTTLDRVLSGYRNLNPPVDRNALVDVVARISWLIADLSGVIVEFDANPVLIDPQSGRALLIDALMVSAGPPQSYRSTGEQ